MYRVYNNKNTIFYFLLIFLYRVLLDITYKNVISIYYAYAGFESKNSFSYLALSWFILFFFAVVCRRFYINKTEKLSYEIFFALFLISIVPFTTMTAFGSCSLSFVAANSCYWLLFCCFISSINWGRKRIRWKVGNIKKLGDVQIELFAILMFLVVLYISGRYTGFRFNFNLLNVYEYREEARLNQLPTVLVYLFSWSRMLNSIFIAYFIWQKKWPWVAVGILTQLLSFGYDGSKTTLLLMLVVVIINLIPTFNSHSMNKWLLISFDGLVAFCLIWFLISKDYTLISLFVRRVLFIPVQIGTNYWDFFTTHIPDFFRQSFLRYLGFKSPYPSIAYMIGDIYSHRITSANNGLISDAVANMGKIGVVIMPFFNAFVFSLLDKSANGLDTRLYITVALYVALTMTNSFIFTILLTHGLLITIILLSTMKRDTIEKQNTKVYPNKGDY